MAAALPSRTHTDHPSPASGSTPGLALWPLPLVAGLLPLLATAIAATISMQQGLVPSCNPFWDGCTSISRAARYELANHVFRALMLPAAVLQGITWLLLARWLHERAATVQPQSPPLPRLPGLRWLAVLGVTAGIALVTYGAFLGTEGPVYRLLRQYGTVVYFGFTCLCTIVAGGCIQRLITARRLDIAAHTGHALTALAALLVTLGVVNAAMAPLLGPEAKLRLENVTEWWGALIFVAVFCILAQVAWQTRLRLTLQAR
jgi:hypothetical protein